MRRQCPGITIVTGEASGDLHGARLAARLRELLPGLEISGVGSWRMREAGVRLLQESSAWSAIGIVQALKLVPALEHAFYRLRKHLKACPPDLLVLIDFGAFNVRLAGRLHPEGIKILYYIPPGCWSREKSYARLRGIVDRVVTPFPWSAEALRREGFEADFFGHPLLDTVRPSLSREEFFGRFGLNPGAPLIGLLPGSRRHEIIHVLPAMLAAADRLSRSVPGAQFAVPLASAAVSRAVARELRTVPWLDVESFEGPEGAGRPGRLPVASAARALARGGGRTGSEDRVAVKLIPGMACEVLACSRAAVVTSGTATTEAAILGCPMVIVYRGSRMMTLEYKLLGQGIKYMGMPNILLDRMVCPELRGEAASPERIAELMLPLVQDSPERDEMLRGLAEARGILGCEGAVDRTARLIVDMLGGGAATGA